MVTSDAGKLYLKVEKGRKPQIRLFEESRNAQVVFSLLKKFMQQ